MSEDAWLWLDRDLDRSEALRYEGWLAWLHDEADPEAEAGYAELYRVYVGWGLAEAASSRTQLVIAESRKERERLREEVGRLGARLHRNPFDLPRFLVSKLSPRVQKMAMASLQPEHEKFAREVAVFKNRHLPKAQRGEQELANIVALSAHPGALGNVRQAIEGSPVHRAVLYGDKRRATTLLVRRAAAAVCKRLESKQLGLKRRHHSLLRRDARAWALTWKRHGGDAQEAWRQDTELLERDYGTYSHFSAAIKPFNDAFGLPVKRGPKPVASSHRGFRVAPTQEGAFHHRRQRG